MKTTLIPYAEIPSSGKCAVLNRMLLVSQDNFLLVQNFLLSAETYEGLACPEPDNYLPGKNSLPILKERFLEYELHTSPKKKENRWFSGLTTTIM